MSPEIMMFNGYDPGNFYDEMFRPDDDVAPVVGNYKGTTHCRLEVRVEVEKL
jgi:hypothetical protein